jgi:Domain of unknown function (DUF4349)
MAEVSGAAPAAVSAPDEGTDSDSAYRVKSAEDSAESPANALQTRAIISTGTVTLRGDDVEEMRVAVRKILDTHRGELSESESESDDKGEMTFARLVLRVPSDAFNDTVEDLRELSEAGSVQTGQEDVTTQVIDVDARVRAQTKSLERIEALLAEANTFRDVVAIESQLTRRQAELDSLKAQQAYLSDQTSMSTITVYLEQLGEPEPEPTDESGFLAGLSDGWNALGNATVGLVTVLGTILPFAVVFALVGYPVWLIARRLGRVTTLRRPTTAGAQESME